MSSNLDPFGWEAKRRRQQAELEAELAEWSAEDEAAAAAEAKERIQLTWNAHRILFALVTFAADPEEYSHATFTLEQWAAHFKIRSTQAADALRCLSRYGIIPKHPEPVPLDGLLRFLADKLKAEEPDESGHGPDDLLYICGADWIMEYARIHEGGVQ